MRSHSTPLRPLLSSFSPTLQGRFKREVDADGLCMGQEFVKAGNVAPWVGEVVLTAAAKVFSSSTQVDITAQLPYFMNPVLAACQMVNVSLPGSEPTLADAQEDMRLFAPELCDKQGEGWMLFTPSGTGLNGNRASGLAVADRQCAVHMCACMQSA